MAGGVGPIRLGLTRSKKSANGAVLHPISNSGMGKGVSRQIVGVDFGFISESLPFPSRGSKMKISVSPLRFFRMGVAG
ncbi:unnamed protein product [Tuwongella immobilis]|uniref:Uncharacterized protein n=1 Tax=Tuwongella immobilis TaxID=692036 RepID=A0A6C2YPL4_9BACT|nr:unnamed protein product [Tuwongella immobilis]VTS03475.1 unnamed protein product [Tuwongella immobilis]